jgi:hypothetical protein
MAVKTDRKEAALTILKFPYRFHRGRRGASIRLDRRTFVIARGDFLAPRPENPGQRTSSSAATNLQIEWARD